MAVTLLPSRGDLTIRTGIEGDPEQQAAAAAVVAEAVALALEAAAAEAAEAVLLTAAAVTEAADRAADAAESARQARASAADAAAQSVAHEAARTASRVRIRADLAAAQVQEAASLAADELAGSIADGTALDTGRMAELLAATVRAAAEATAQDTTRAAVAVAQAADYAAAHVSETVAAAEEAVETEVAATAEAKRELATATAAAVALETDAQAVGVAAAAREAAAALLVEEQDEGDVDREAAPAAQVGATPAPGTPAPGTPAPIRPEETEEILAAAEERDSRAELRDRSADERERAASLRSFIGDEQYQEYEQHAMGLPMRRAAALDRLDSKDDRAFAASARARLSVLPPRGSLPGGVDPDAYLTELVADLSHDLSVPLSSIVASMEMLEDELGGDCDRSVAAHLGRAMRAGERMVRMLDQNMASHSPGQRTTMSEVNLAEIVRQLVLDSTGLLEPVGAVVKTGELPVVRADPDEMYSVLQNLLTNAVKFACPGVPAVVRISARRSEDGWRISVRDNGVGLPETGGDGGVDVFSLFSRGTSAVTGHGIGLATVARIITAHGGRVGSTPAETGAEIWFELPDDEAVQ